jgi:hypothetical protein
MLKRTVSASAEPSTSSLTITNRLVRRPSEPLLGSVYTNGYKGMAHMNSGNATKVLTVRQPHAHLLIHGSPNAGIKDVENRAKLTRYRGTLLIQASAKVDQAAYASYIAEGIKLPPAEQLVTGAIIGSVEVTGCVSDSRSRWAESGYQHWLTAAPRAADPVIPSKGQLSMYPAPDGWQASFRPTR